ncbi:DUF4345 family protein [Pseudohongiella sp.]|uniref:DUF4345 domain-containing protein n=1 Tax=marine sediment metagenome TaxID=412755 RepID=A0A0F9W7L2_9ZZZZ|nr:DUF4345 family protein [Pseudohongiella sp.]HDZ07477.1 DUF4345 domain-containing protein [Pseudohongiella sp.]HEA63018.1 DUF4345 domain-containing protein [Pseudohongiella sp.]
MMLGKTVLGVSALVFIAYGLVSLVSPAIPAGFAGLEMGNGDAFAEVGAMYGGLQTGIGGFCLLALIKPDFYRGGLALLTIGIGAMTMARLVSLLMATDAVSAYSYGALGYECATAVLAAVAWAKK